jgi:hypothetical protein
MFRVEMFAVISVLKFNDIMYPKKKILLLTQY